ncbi:MAG: AbrB/MazE/SpoVT family DNA-binding domain-containing protein [Haloarculaceae archaeon]
MKTRKLQQVGGGTYTVSIPKAWADEHALEAGMDLHLYTHADGSIVVRTAERDGDALASATVEVAGDAPELVERALVAAHAVGFETVTLRPDEAFTREQRRAARSVVRDLVGTDLLVEADDEITVQHLLDASTVSVRQSVVQLQFTALSVHREATAALLEGEVSAERARERAAEADRLARMVRRHAARSLTSFAELDRLGVSRTELFDYEATARALRRVAHEAVRTAEAAEGLSGPLPSEVGETVSETAAASRNVVEEATTAVLDGPDATAAHAALDRRDDAVTTVTAATDALFDASVTAFDGAVSCPDGVPEGDTRAATDDATSSDDSAASDGGVTPEDRACARAAATGRVLDSVRRTAECGASVADVALQAAVRAERE